MAYDEGLAERVRGELGARTDVTEKKMFGGLAFMVHGHMACGITGEDLMVRVGPEGWAQALSRPGAREMDFTGKSLKGFVFVAADAVSEDDALAGWVGLALDYVGTLPPK